MYVSLNPHGSHDEGHIISGCHIILNPIWDLNAFSPSELFFALIKNASRCRPVYLYGLFGYGPKTAHCGFVKKNLWKSVMCLVKVNDFDSFFGQFFGSIVRWHSALKT